MLQLERMESLAETCRTGLPRGVDVCRKLRQLPLEIEPSCGSMWWWLLQSGLLSLGSMWFLGCCGRWGSRCQMQSRRTMGKQP